MSVPVFFRDEDSIRRCCNFIETWTCSITQQCSRVIAACHPDWRDVCKTLCHGNGHVILRLIVKPEIEVNPLSGIHRSINTVSNILKQKIAWHDLVAVSSLACTWMKLLQPIEKWNCLFFFFLRWYQWNCLWVKDRKISWVAREDLFELRTK